MRVIALLLILSLIPSAAFAQPPDQLDPNIVTWLHPSIAGFQKTSAVTGFTGWTPSSREICVHHTKAGQWPVIQFGEIVIEGNIWVFAPINGAWYGATWDRLRPGQYCKGSESAAWLDIMGAWQIRRFPMDESWIPKPGSPICFATSTPVRDGFGPVNERSNIACTTVGGSGTAPVPTPPAPQPTPVPPPPPQPVPVPTDGLVLKLDEIAASVLRVEAEVVRAREERWGWGDFWSFVGKYIAPAVAALFAGLQMSNQEE